MAQDQGVCQPVSEMICRHRTLFTSEAWEKRQNGDAYRFSHLAAVLRNFHDAAKHGDVRMGLGLQEVGIKDLPCQLRWSKLG
jgi:hypothetical protein